MIYLRTSDVVLIPHTTRRMTSGKRLFETDISSQLDFLNVWMCTFYVLRDSDLGSLYSCYVSCIFFISFYKNAPTSQVVVDFSEFELAVSVNNSRAQVKVSQHTDMLGLKILLVHLWSGEVFSCCTEPRKFVCTWLRECYRQVEAEVISYSRSKLHQTTYKEIFSALYYLNYILIKKKVVLTSQGY